MGRAVLVSSILLGSAGLVPALVVPRAMPIPAEAPAPPGLPEWTVGPRLQTCAASPDPPAAVRTAPAKPEPSLVSAEDDDFDVELVDARTGKPVLVDGGHMHVRRDAAPALARGIRPADPPSHRIRCDPVGGRPVAFDFPGFRRSFLADPPKGGETLVLRLDPAASVEGVVLRRDGSPAGGVWVSVAPRTQPTLFVEQWTSTDARGAYRLSGLEEGTVEVVVDGEHVRRACREAWASNPPGLADFVVETGGSIRATWHFCGGARLVGGDDLESISVFLIPPDGGRIPVSLWEWETSMGLVEATWAATGLYDGKYGLSLAVLGEAERRWELEVSDLRTATVDVTPPAGQIVVRAGPSWARTTRVTLTNPRSGRSTVYDPASSYFEWDCPDDDKRWRFWNVIAGAYRVQVDEGDAKGAARDVVVVAGETTVVDAPP